MIPDAQLIWAAAWRSSRKSGLERARHFGKQKRKNDASPKTAASFVKARRLDVQAVVPANGSLSRADVLGQAERASQATWSPELAEAEGKLKRRAQDMKAFAIIGDGGDGHVLPSEIDADDAARALLVKKTREKHGREADNKTRRARARTAGRPQVDLLNVPVRWEDGVLLLLSVSL